MKTRTLTLAGVLAASFVAATALAEEAKQKAPTPPPAPTAGTSTEAPMTPTAEVHPRESAKEPRGRLGEKNYKQRINVVARRPLRRDLTWLEGADREGWNGFTTWHGIRDERPLVARKTMGFHTPRPHRPRRERVLMISRGPLRGPAPTE